MAQKRLELSEMQQKETEQLLQRTKVIFDSRVTDKPICPDIEAQLTQCYRFISVFDKPRLYI